MQGIVRRADGKLMLALPEAFMERHGLIEGAVFKIEPKAGGLMLSVPGAHPPRPRYTLAELLRQIPEGEPLPIDREWEQAPPQGREQL